MSVGDIIHETDSPLCDCGQYLSCEDIDDMTSMLECHQCGQMYAFRELKGEHWTGAWEVTAVLLPNAMPEVNP